MTEKDEAEFSEKFPKNLSHYSKEQILSFIAEVEKLAREEGRKEERMKPLTAMEVSLKGQEEEFYILAKQQIRSSLKAELVEEGDELREKSYENANTNIYFAPSYRQAISDYQDIIKSA